MDNQFLNRFEKILEPLGNQSAPFFLAASLYHAHKVSFQKAAELAGLSFDEFKSSLKEHFNMRFMIEAGTAMEDISEMDSILAEAAANGVDWHQVATEYPDTMDALQSGFEAVVSQADKLLAKARQFKSQSSVSD